MPLHQSKKPSDDAGQTFASHHKVRTNQQPMTDTIGLQGMHQLRLIDNKSPQAEWRETDFAEEIPPAAMTALASYYPLARCPDRASVEQWIATDPGFSGPHCILFRLADKGIEIVRRGSEVCSASASALIRIIEQDILGSEDGARRYEIHADDIRDATVLPLLQNAGLCLAVVI